MRVCFLLFFFFFQAEDGIRDDLVTGVQTCALPISVLVATATPQKPHAAVLRHGHQVRQAVLLGHRLLKIVISRIKYLKMLMILVCMDNGKMVLGILPQVTLKLQIMLLERTLIRGLLLIFMLPEVMS